MLTAYLDESSDDRVYTVAGFMATDDCWTRFSAEWEGVLKCDPAISHFKMHDVRTSRTNGVFKNHSMQRRLEKTESLIHVLNKHLSTSTDFAGSVVMDVKAYKEILQPILNPKLRNPYLWCFQGILVCYSSWIREMLPDHKTDFVFDDNKKEFRDALKLYELVANLPAFVESRCYVGAIKPGDDKRVMPLQAADMLAGQVRLYGRERDSATFMQSITRSDRSQFSYLLGVNALMALRATIHATSAWAQYFIPSGVSNK
jgi:hypothetical protein